MTNELILKLERLAAAGIQIIPSPEVTSHFILERDGCVVLVERRGEGFGAVGSPGMLSSHGGFAALVEQDGRPWFVAKGEKRQALPGEAETARRLFNEVKGALR